MPGTVYAAVEAEGAYVTTDYGRSWTFRNRGLHGDPHHLLALDRDVVIAACGRGLHRARDGGCRWLGLDTPHSQFWFTYYREAIEHEGVLYAGARDRSEARHCGTARETILESRTRGDAFDPREYPGREADFVDAWAPREGTVFGGTIGGRLLSGPDGWTETARFDGTIRALFAVAE